MDFVCLNYSSNFTGLELYFEPVFIIKEVYETMKSKHMSSGTVAAAGNDIRGSLADFRGPLTFPRLGLLVIYDFVRSSFSAMFHCKNNKTARQNQTGNPKKERKKRERERAGRFVIDDLCESKAGQHR